jgi:TolA-binding protein
MRIRGGLVELFPGDNREVNLIHGTVAVVNVVAPHLALRAHSKVTVFVQTDSGRKMVKRRRVEGAQAPQFDITVPGTRMLTGHIGITDLRHYRAPIFSAYGGSAYLFGLGPNSPPRDGSFTMAFPLTAGSLGDETPLRRDKVEQVLARCFRDSSVATEDKRASNLGRAMKDAGLYGYPVAKPGDRVHFGLPYLDEQGERQWLTASGRVITHAQLDVLEEDQRTVCRNALLGDRIFVRVLDLGHDTSDLADKLEVQVSSRSGADHTMTLTETEEHTGIFKGSFQLTIAEPTDDMPGEYNVRTMGFPATYGDKLTVNYTDKQGREMPEHTFSVGLGADGTIKPFTKQYGDDEIATRTQFAMAEAYLEVARRYRKLKNRKGADVGFRRAKQLLASTIERFHDAETRAHAEYLLGNLTYEEAAATRDTFLKEERYQTALARFQKVTSSYPDTSFASKAQFKKAVVYERLKEPDIAAQEYVKLAYRYPDSEHIAVALARLGVHFLRKASRAEKESKVLLKKTHDKDMLYKGDLAKKQAIKDYSKSARIFDRLLDRFPNHELASKAGLMSGKSFMRSLQTQKALAQFKILVGKKSYDDLSRAEAMYWSGKCFGKLSQPMAAYAIYMRCTDDFPETKWSSYCLSELSQPRFKEIDSRLELERLKEGL